MNKSERRDSKRNRIKAKRIKHNYGKRKQVDGISKAWKKIIKSKIL